MKCRRRLLALVLALVLSFSLVTGASAATAQTITATLSPDVTVKYNNEVQAMADVKGNPVYPVLYNGTTYLPIRAVSNMLGIAVDWDQATRTVLLADEGDISTVKTANAGTKPAAQTINATLSPDITVEYNGEVQTMKDVTGTVVYPVLYNGTTYLPIRAVSNMLGVAVDWDQATRTVLLGESAASAQGEDVTLLTSAGSITINTGDEAGAYKALSAAGISDDEAKAILAQVKFITTDTLDGFMTSADAMVLGTNHIAYDYVEIDWSTANDGYVKVNLHKSPTEQTMCSVQWNDGTTIKVRNWYLPSGRWVNIPLIDGNQEYGISVYPLYTENDNDKSTYRNPLQARFTAEIKDTDALWLLSHIKVDYENAPNACAKALELTKNCKTEAEKITAIYNYVSATINYDYALAAEDEARLAAGESNLIISAERDLSLDNILANKTGVCEHYAVLMAGMLRNIGIECKVAIGPVKLTSGKTQNHAWVLVKPATGTLDKTALGAGTDGNWIRLDPTNAGDKAFTSNNSNYTTDYCY